MLATRAGDDSHQYSISSIVGAGSAAIGSANAVCNASSWSAARTRRRNWRFDDRNFTSLLFYYRLGRRFERLGRRCDRRGGDRRGHNHRLGHRLSFRLLGNLRTFAQAVRDPAAIDFDLLEHAPHVFVAGEYQELVTLLGEITQHRASGSRAAGVEVYEYVVEDHRQVDAAAAIRGD